MLVMYILFSLFRSKSSSSQTPIALDTQVGQAKYTRSSKIWADIIDVVDIDTLDLYEDEHEETSEDREDDTLRKQRLEGRLS